MKKSAWSLLPILLLSLTLLPASFTFADVPNEDLYSDEEPLMPDQAFVLSNIVIDSNMIQVQWDIVKGYYMYRDKFVFTSNTPGITLGKPSFPPGKIKEDEFFGKVETYRKKVIVDIPVTRADDIRTLELTTVSQGCADLGVCYPPQTQKVSFNLPAVTAAPAFNSTTPKSNSFSVLKQLGASLGLGGGDEEFLTPDQAFSFSSETVNGNAIKVNWQIAEGYYLYRDKFKFEIRDAQGINISSANFPAGDIKNDEYFGKMEVFHKEVTAHLALSRTNFDATNITLVAKYQGCAEAGFCYPPQEKIMPMALPTGLAEPAAGSIPTGNNVSSDNDDISDTDRIAAMLGTDNIIITMFSFFIFGLLLAFTPCVFPMIPILSSLIVGQGEHITTRRAFALSLVYVLAMALTYTAAGVIAGVFGENLTAAFQNPWILSTFAGIFVLLSLSMFGFYDLQMPASIQSKFTNISNSQEGGTLIGVAIMGLLSALIVGPCVAAPLAGALIYIGQTGDAVLGGLALFALSMGMGAPLLAIGTSAGKLMPKAGGWMDTIKSVFGVMLLAVAIWMLERILPIEATMLLIAALVIITATFMGALEPVEVGAPGWTRFWKGTGLMMFVYGVLLIIGAAAGGNSYMQPLHGIAMGVGGGTGGTASATHLQFKRFKGSAALDREITAANAQGKPVMLDFYADWCISCKEMEKFTFTDPEVQRILSKAVLIQADVTKNDDEDKALLKRFKLVGPPAILFFGLDGQERRKYRTIGFVKPEKFSKIATKGLQ